MRKIGAMNRQAVHADKGAHKHFMMKEINEQPVVLADGIAHYIDRKNAALTLPDIGVDFAALEGLTLIACGTAHLAASVAKYWFEQLAGVACSLDIASEFRYRNSPMRAGSVAVFYQPIWGNGGHAGGDASLQIAGRLYGWNCQCGGVFYRAGGRRSPADSCGCGNRCGIDKSLHVPAVSVAVFGSESGG